MTQHLDEHMCFGVVTHASPMPRGACLHTKAPLPPQSHRSIPHTYIMEACSQLNTGCAKQAATVPAQQQLPCLFTGSCKNVHGTRYTCEQNPFRYVLHDTCSAASPTWSATQQICDEKMYLRNFKQTASTTARRRLCVQQMPQLQSDSDCSAVNSCRATHNHASEAAQQYAHAVAVVTPSCSVSQPPSRYPSPLHATTPNTVQRAHGPPHPVSLQSMHHNQCTTFQKASHSLNG